MSENWASRVLQTALPSGDPSSQASTMEDGYPADVDHEIINPRQRRKRHHASLRKRRGQHLVTLWRQNGSSEAVEPPRNANLDEGSALQAGLASRVQTMLTLNVENRDKPVSTSPREPQAEVQNIAMRSRDAAQAPIRTAIDQKVIGKEKNHAAVKWEYRPVASDAQLWDCQGTSHVSDERFWTATAQAFKDVPQPVLWPAEIEGRLLARHRVQLLGLFERKTVPEVTAQPPSRPPMTSESVRQEPPVLMPPRVSNAPRSIPARASSPLQSHATEYAVPKAPGLDDQTVQRWSYSHFDPTVATFRPQPRRKRKPDSEELSWREHAHIEEDCCGQCGGDFVCSDDGVTFNCETCRVRRPEAPAAPIVEPQSQPPTTSRPSGPATRQVWKRRRLRSNVCLYGT